MEERKKTTFGRLKGKCYGCGEVKGLTCFVNDGRTYCDKCLDYVATLAIRKEEDKP